jgi:D-serine deaminase-like pyridoxal phosphate-dependent protein
MWSNGEEMLRRAGGKPIRVASKSVRSRELLRRILERDPGFRGLMTFTLDESLWLHEHGFDDLLLAYPTADRSALARYEGREPILMVDSIAHLDLIPGPARVCIEFDTSYWLAGGKLKIGTKRSPLRTPEQVVELAREIQRRNGVELVALMGYEGHIAGLGDRPSNKAKGAAIEQMQKKSVAELAERRAAIVAEVRELAELQIVNGGGTGSLHTTSLENAVTEITAGSGFYAPTLFDQYSAFTLKPAAMFTLPVVRRPGPGVATALGGGYIASGPAQKDRLPQPYLPEGLKLDPLEGAGEVQTPLSGRDDLKVGDRVYMRHAKAGELCERFNSLYLVEGDKIADEVPTYRGEGKAFL